jgi:chaperone modulatory protein CbpM
MDDQLQGDSEETVSALRQLAELCRVDMPWLLLHQREGLLGDVVSGAGSGPPSERIRVRICRMHGLERDFDAVPELAALVADFLDELDLLRAERRAALERRPSLADQPARWQL